MSKNDFLFLMFSDVLSIESVRLTEYRLNIPDLKTSKEKNDCVLHHVHIF